LFIKEGEGLEAVPRLPGDRLIGPSVQGDEVLAADRGRVDLLEVVEGEKFVFPLRVERS